MNKMVKIIIISTAISSSVFSAPSQLFYEKVLSGGQNIVHVEPILDSQNELNGFVYTNASSNSLIIDQFESDSVITIEVPDSPLKTIMRYSALKDTIYLYTLSLSDEQFSKPKITLTAFSDQSFQQQIIETETNIGISNISISSYPVNTNLDFRFYPDNKNPMQIIYECSFQVDEYYATIGYESNSVSTSLLYNLDLSEILFTSSEASIYPGYLFSEIENNYVYSDNHYHTHDYSNMGIGSSIYQKLRIEDEFEGTVFELTTNYNQIFSVHVGNFSPSSLTDELIIHANSIDLLNSYSSKNHIACYEFTSGIPSENWYNDDVAGIDFQYTYKTKDLLVGTDSSSNIFMLNYLNGAITDSAEIKSDLRNVYFYETGTEFSLLNLVGMSGDTLKSYRFDISTDIQEQVATEELPKTFELYQNHPNPFNGETRLEFSTTENQYLKLSIFNILGQEIKTVVANRFSPGSYSYYWNGSDENGLSQSTGIYFARLESATTSDLIKLIYLK